MKHACFVCLFLCLTTPFLLSQSKPTSPSASQIDPKAQTQILENYGKLPLSFEANHGQSDGQVKFLSRTGAYSLFLTADEAVLALSGKKASADKAKSAGTSHKSPGLDAPKAGGVLRMKLRNANADAKVTGVDEMVGTSNYFIGNDPAKWRTGVPTYAKVKYEQIYSGIDLVYYGNQRQLEYDFIVAPGADPHSISFDVRGAKRIRRDEHGNLVLKMNDTEIRWHKPVVYQEKNGTRQEIVAHYVIADTNRVGFELAKYDTSKPLYIDPLIYSTYLGGSGTDNGLGIVLDAEGDIYVTGNTWSTNFPTLNPWQASNHGYYNAFVAKLNPTGSALVYSTYLGGSNEDAGLGIAIDSTGNAYVCGGTQSTDFPVTPGAFQTACGNSNPSQCITAFVTKLDPAGSALVYSTYLGGTKGNDGGLGDDGCSGIAVDGTGNAYVTGGTASTDFPTMNPLQPANGGSFDAFVTKINPSGSALVYSTYLGGSGPDEALGIDVDSMGNAYITGSTFSTNFPVTSGAFQTTCGNPSQCLNAFVAKINPSGSSLVYSTYLGGTGYGDGGTAIAVDGAGDAYVTGSTASTDFPTTPGAFQTVCNGGSNCHNDGDAFVAKINPSGSGLVYSTYLGGNKEDAGLRVAVDSSGDAYVTGYTESSNFPTKNPLHGTPLPGAFLSRLNSSGSALVYSTGVGGDRGYGVEVDMAGNVYVTGFATSKFLTTPGAFQTTYGGGTSDAFVTELHLMAATTATLSSSTNPSAYGQAVPFTAVVTSDGGVPPDGETVSFMKGTSVLGTGMLSGGSASFTSSTLKSGTTAVTAVYAGDSNFLHSKSKAVSQLVSKATTTTAISSSPNPSNAGQTVTFTASVTPQYGGSVTGTVTFYDGTTLLKTMGLSGGTAKFTTSKLTAGAHSIMATYNGSTSFDGSSSSPLTQTVN